MPVADWNASTEWDILELAGIRMPGVAHVVVDMPSGLDCKKPKGGKKGRISDGGAQPARVDVELELQADEMAELESVIPKLRPRSLGAPQEALSISHPNCRLWGVNLVKVGKIGSPMPKSGGTFTLKFQCVEHVARPKAVKAPKKVAEGDWNTKRLIKALDERPSANNAAEQNFSSPEQPQGSGADDSYTPADGPLGSGFE